MKLSRDEILYINALASISGVNAKDCFIEDKVISYVVKEEAVGKAIGKNATVIKNLRNKLNRSVEIFAHTKSVEDFIKKALYNIKINDVEVRENDGKKEIAIVVDSENRRKLLSNSKRFKRIKEITKRNYNINNIRIK